MANLAAKASVEGRASFKIHTPLIKLPKAEIIKKGAELGVDFSMTWSCYDPQPAAAGNELKTKTRNALPVTRRLRTRRARQGLVPCRRCDSCLLRAKGFREAGLDDPLEVQEEHL
jgi:7-cyano-7-deazaguanine synthase